MSRRRLFILICAALSLCIALSAPGTTFPCSESPKPDETHRSLLCALCDSRICIGTKNEAKGHSVGDFELLPLRRNFLREFGIDSIFVFNRQNRVCGE